MGSDNVADVVMLFLIVQSDCSKACFHTKFVRISVATGGFVKLVLAEENNFGNNPYLIIKHLTIVIGCSNNTRYVVERQFVIVEARY